MALSPGTRLGHYDVTTLLGEGGTGEVYQARDTKLDRDVALKVLPEAFTSDLDPLARFEREAKVLASLNPPNIGSIYGLEEAEGVRALVLELVEGPTLADRIKQPVCRRHLTASRSCRLCRSVPGSDSADRVGWDRNSRHRWSVWRPPD